MNIIYTGRQIVVACAPIALRERLHANFSVLPATPRVEDLLALPAVESVNLNIAGGAEGAHIPPFPYPVIPALTEAPPPEVSLSILYTQHARWLLSLFNSPTYPDVGVDILIVNRVTGSALYFPSCIPRNLTLNFAENRLLGATIGFIAPAGFILPPNSVPPYYPDAHDAKYVRLFTSLFIDEYGLPPLGTIGLSVNISNSISAYHTMLGAPPSTEVDATAVRFARIFSFGIPTVSATIRALIPPAQLPPYKDGAAVSMLLTGYDVEFDVALIGFVLRGVLQSVNVSFGAQDEVIFQASVSGVGDAIAPPVVFL